MAKLTSTDTDVAASRPAPGWTRWAHSAARCPAAPNVAEPGRATNGHSGRDTGAAVAAARPVMLVRFLPGVAGETARVVHVVALPTEEQAGAVGAWCGAALMVHDIETVIPGVGMPCTGCILSPATGTPEELRWRPDVGLACIQPAIPDCVRGTTETGLAATEVKDS